MAGENQHQRVQATFSDYVEGELPEEQRRPIDAHLETCIQCRTELQRFRATVGGLGALRTKAPGRFLNDIQDQIRTRSRGRFFTGRKLLFGRLPFEWLSLAMIVAMLVYYIVVMRGSPTDVTPAP